MEHRRIVPFYTLALVIGFAFALSFQANAQCGSCGGDSAKPASAQAASTSTGDGCAYCQGTTAPAQKNTPEGLKLTPDQQNGNCCTTCACCGENTCQPTNGPNTTCYICIVNQIPERCLTCLTTRCGAVCYGGVTGG